MVEINNQRKGVPRYAEVGGNWVTDVQETRNHGYDVIVGGELFTDYSDHPRKLVTLNPKLKSTSKQDAANFFPVGGMPYRKQLGLKDFSRKSQDAVALQQIKERGALPMIDRGDIRQAIDRCSNIWASPGAGAVDRHGLTATWLQNSKKRAEPVREIDVWNGSHRDYLRSGYLHHRLPVMGC